VRDLETQSIVFGFMAHYPLNRKQNCKQIAAASPNIANLGLRPKTPRHMANENWQMAYNNYNSSMEIEMEWKSMPQRRQFSLLPTLI